VTPQMKTAFEFIDSHLTEHGIAPTHAELCDAMNLGSKSGSHRLISALEKRGYIKRRPHLARSTEIIRRPEPPWVIRITENKNAQAIMAVAIADVITGSATPSQMADAIISRLASHGYSIMHEGAGR